MDFIEVSARTVDDAITEALVKLCATSDQIEYEVVEEEKETIPEGKRKCSGCGEIIDDADIFCANCGTKKEETEENK